MARIRTIKPEYWVDQKIGKLSRDARLLFIALLSHSDDYGTVRSSPALIRANAFPYDEKLTVEEVKQWLQEVLDQGLLVPFEYSGESFYHIKNFGKHQKVDHPSRPIVPHDVKAALENTSRDPRESVAPEVGSSNESSKGVEGEDNTHSHAPNFKNDSEGYKYNVDYYYELAKSLKGKDYKTVWCGISEFIDSYKPDYLEPYVDMWNVFAEKSDLPCVIKITDEIQTNLSLRLKERLFNLHDIIQAIKKDPFLKGQEKSSWKVSFQWLIKSEDNYLKVLSNSKPKAKQPA
jgi:hypothetical protein